MRKARCDKRDTWLAFLDYTNTPTEGLTTSPAQRLFNRRTKMLLPNKMPSLLPYEASNESENRMTTKRKQMEWYKTARDLPVLVKGDTVRVQPLGANTKGQPWKKAVISNTLPNRS